MGNYQEVMQRTEWFRHDRFGLFIHWGLYSVAGRHEWAKSHERITDEAYQKYFDNFTAEHYDPVAWAKLAKKAGMKYAVLTVKHHEGFCLFDSAYTDYKSTNAPAARDLAREFVDAFRAEGLKVGFYYSLIDWHHPDYPHASDPIHPQRNNPDYADDNRNFDRYLDYMHAQVRELCENYGKIDIMWFDYSYGEMRGEKWRGTQLIQMIRSLQPHIVIDNRLDGSGDATGLHDNLDEAPIYCGDFVSPEQYVPTEGIKDELGRDKPWEACITTQETSWGYVSHNKTFMSAREVVYMLVDCVSKNGNLLLNVGPNAKGEFPKQTVALLEEVGEWTYQNGESIYGCGAVPYPQPEWGRLTGKEGVVYAHIFDKSGYCLVVDGLPTSTVDYGLFLRDLAECKLGDFWNSSVLGSYVSIAHKKGNDDNLDTVIKIVLKKEN